MSPRARTAGERREAAAARRERRAAVTDPDVVMQAAAAFLGVRSRSVEETRRRLNQLGYPAALVDDVVARLVELGYLDDAAFARAWVESRDRAHPRGTMALRRELQRKGIADDTIGMILDDRAASAGDPGEPGRGTADADLAAARALIERRRSGLSREPDPRRRRQKAYALLARSGFTPDVCQEVAMTVAGEPDDEVEAARLTLPPKPR